MPEWRNATAMLSQALQGSQDRTAVMLVHPDSYNEMKHSGKYMHRGDVDNSPLEYVHPFGRVLIYSDPGHAGAGVPHVAAEWTGEPIRLANEHQDHGRLVGYDVEDVFVEGEFRRGVPQAETNERNLVMLQPEARGLFEYFREEAGRNADNRTFNWMTDELRPGTQWVEQTTQALRNYGNRTTIQFTGVATR